jgi:Mrp family chromosome partitioning ATPase
VGTNAPKQQALLTDYNADSAYSIAYQTLYANIRFNWDSAQTRQHSILLATPAAYPGQATAVANIAIAAAQNGTPTILVDANLHASGLQQLFKTNAPTGLSDLLLTNREITAQALTSHLCETDMPRLRLLSAGKALAQPQEIARLLTARLQDLLSPAHASI